MAERTADAVVPLLAKLVGLSGPTSSCIIDPSMHSSTRMERRTEADMGGSSLSTDETSGRVLSADCVSSSREIVDVAAGMDGG